jgi:DNA repair exonuclease SbcCD ATPase subunit
LEQLRLRYRRLDEQRRHLQEAARELEVARATVERRQGDLGQVNAAIAALLAADPAAASNVQSTGGGAPFEQRIAALEEERQALRDAVRQQEQERRSRQARCEQQRAAIESLASVLDASVDVPTSELMERARERQGALTDELTILEASGSKLAALEAGSQEAAAILDYLDLKANVERLESSRPEAELRLRALQEAHARLVCLQTGLQAIHSAAAELGEARLQRALDTVLPLANRYFDRLGGHPTYSALTLQPQMQRGASIYALLAHDSDLEHATFLPTRLSHTQIHIAALAIFLALAAQPLHRLDLLLLDDPAQSMDAERRQALATVLAQAAAARQVLVTTEDGAFGDQLLAAARGPARVLHLASWDSGGVRVDG